MIFHFANILFLTSAFDSGFFQEALKSIAQGTLCMRFADSVCRLYGHFVYLFSHLKPSSNRCSDFKLSFNSRLLLTKYQSYSFRWHTDIEALRLFLSIRCVSSLTFSSLYVVVSSVLQILHKGLQYFDFLLFLLFVLILRIRFHSHIFASELFIRRNLRHS